MRAALVAAAIGVAGATAAGAAPIQGAGPLGAFTGTLSYSAVNATTATLTVTLTNTTTPAALGGYITGFVLNNPSDRITGVSLSNVAGVATFDLLALNNNAVGGSPYGQFDFGAALGGSFEGGGSPNGGVGVGQADSFVFSLTGTNLTSLSDASFLSALSSGSGAGQGYEEMVVRFRGFAGGGSDKVPVSSGTPIPEPASLALLGAGLLGLGLARRRRRRS